MTRHFITVLSLAGAGILSVQALRIPTVEDGDPKTSPSIVDERGKIVNLTAGALAGDGVQVIKPFYGPGNFSLFGNQAGPYIGAVPDPQNDGAACTRQELINILSGQQRSDSQGRVPVIYEAQLAAYNISQLQMSSFSPNDPHGMKVVRLQQRYGPNKSWIAYAKVDETPPYGGKTYYEQSNPGDSHSTPMLVVGCGKADPVGLQAYGASLYVLNAGTTVANLFGGDLMSDGAEHYWTDYSEYFSLDVDSFNVTKHAKPGEIYASIPKYCMQLSAMAPGS